MPWHFSNWGNFFNFNNGSPPVAVNDGYGFGEDSVTTFNVLSNDYDPNLDSFSLRDVNGVIIAVGDVRTLGSGATLTYLGGGSFSYDTNGKFNGLAQGQNATESFTYRIVDSRGLVSNSATVTLQINGANDAPVAVVDSGVVSEDGSVVLSVLANDTDVDQGDTRALAALNTTGTQGSATANPDGTVSYIPGSAFQYLRAGESATDSFTYTVRDALGATSTTTVTVTVNGSNDGPVVSGIVTGTAIEDGPAVPLSALGSAYDPDHDTVLSVVNLPASLPAGVTYDAATKTFILDPTHQAYQQLASGQTQDIVVTYGVSDGAVTQAASVKWTVTGANDAPVATAVIRSVAEDGSASGTVGGTDAEGATLTFALVNGPTKGTLEFNSDGTYTYTPGADFTGTDSFSFRASDGLLDSEPATVSLNVTPVNDGPVAADDSAAVNEKSSITIDVLGNDADIDAGDSKALVSVSGSVKGASLSIVDGQVVYVANADSFDLLKTGQSTTDSFTYTMRDAAGATSTATVTVTINGIADGASRTGTAGNDVINGGALDERLDGALGNDTISGGGGADTVLGGFGNDKLLGDGGIDSINGGDGNDNIEGGAGGDMLAGGRGLDVFTFGANFGRDVIIDFRPGEDVIRFTGGAFSSFSEIQANASQVGANVVITAPTGDSIQLNNVLLTNLQASDFLFA